MITTKITTVPNYVIEFTEEQLNDIGLKPNDKLSISVENGAIVLQKFTTVELEIDKFSREDLENLIKISIEEDISVNEVISNLLKQFIAEQKQNGSNNFI